MPSAGSTAAHAPAPSTLAPSPDQPGPGRERVNPEHLDYFKFIGRVLGLAVFHHRFLDAYFVPSFYRMVLGKKNPITGRARRDLLCDGRSLWRARHRRAQAGRRHARRTEANKEEYVNLVVAHRITGQFHAFMKGLGDVLPLDLLRVFDEHELELLIGGMMEIDMDDWTRSPITAGTRRRRIA
ncbi:hypothetical protein EDB86DRAFT_141768 [Lactarius hatsudake]|nr:hypothetical protein EDB86DRAFT_141768 [Lactarius hatsudake]